MGTFARTALVPVALLASLPGFGGAVRAQGVPAIATGAAPTLTYGTLDQLQRSLTGGSYTGVGTLFVSLQSTATTDVGRLCTGSLVAGNVALTAGHCLFDYTETGVYDPVRSVSLYLPSLAEATAGNVFTASSWTVNPAYTGNLFAGADLSLLTLSRVAVGHDVYGLYTAGGEIDSVFTRVGTGTTGGPGGAGTGDGAANFYQRSGVNSFDAYGDRLFSNVSHDVLLSDFDDGTATHDVFGRAGLAFGSPFATGVRNAAGIVIDTDLSPGDSGGPDFINGRIAGIGSFGLSGAVLDGGICGSAGNVDPAAGPDGQCTNFSVGEIAGDTRVAAYAGFIQSYIAAAAVPEPATWLTAILGLGLAGLPLRRDRSRRASRSAVA